jgi:hypothetical protein
MRHILVATGLVWASTLLSGTEASAGLIMNPAKRSFPDVAADINGTVNYTFDQAANQGTFSVTNTPYLIAVGPGTGSEFVIMPTENGTRRQSLTLKTDSSGNLIQNSGTYELWGTFTTPLETYTGLLLKGTPTKFGSQDLGSPQTPDAVGGGFTMTPVGGAGLVSDSDIFDAEIAVTGGQLAEFFGPTAYMRITPELESTFTGKFDTNFTAVKATSNTRGLEPKPIPIPEPTTIAVLLAGGVGLAVRHRRNRAAQG